MGAWHINDLQPHPTTEARGWKPEHEGREYWGLPEGVTIHQGWALRPRNVIEKEIAERVGFVEAEAGWWVAALVAALEAAPP